MLASMQAQLQNVKQFTGEENGGDDNNVLQCSIKTHSGILKRLTKQQESEVKINSGDTS